MGFRVEGISEASLTSDAFVACLSWTGLAGPVVREFASFRSHRTASVQRGGKGVGSGGGGGGGRGGGEGRGAVE